MRTKTGKRRWCAKDCRNYLTALVNEYHVDPNTGVLYHVVDAGNNTDYASKVYDSHSLLMETEQRYFNDHFKTRALKFANEMEQHGAHCSEFSLFYFLLCLPHRSFLFSCLILFYIFLSKDKDDEAEEVDKAGEEE